MKGSNKDVQGLRSWRNIFAARLNSSRKTRMLWRSTTRPRSWVTSNGSSMQIRWRSLPIRRVQSFSSLLCIHPHTHALIKSWELLLYNCNSKSNLWIIQNPNMYLEDFIFLAYVGTTDKVHSRARASLFPLWNIFVVNFHFHMWASWYSMIFDREKRELSRNVPEETSSANRDYRAVVVMMICPVVKETHQQCTN